MPTAEEAVDPSDPMLWWAARETPVLGGMAAPGAGFAFGALAELGFDGIVSLAGPQTYDAAPLSGIAFQLEDLFGGKARTRRLSRAPNGYGACRTARRGPRSGEETP